MLSVSWVILAKNFPSGLHLEIQCQIIHCVITTKCKYKPPCTHACWKCTYTDLKIGQWAELSQWKPLFFWPVRTSQIMIACGSSFVSIRGLNVTTYLWGGRIVKHLLLRCIKSYLVLFFFLITAWQILKQTEIRSQKYKRVGTDFLFVLYNRTVISFPLGWSYIEYIEDLYLTSG